MTHVYRAPSEDVNLSDRDGNSALVCWCSRVATPTQCSFVYSTTQLDVLVSQGVVAQQGRVSPVQLSAGRVLWQKDVLKLH